MADIKKYGFDKPNHNNHSFNIKENKDDKMNTTTIGSQKYPASGLFPSSNSAVKTEDKGLGNVNIDGIVLGGSTPAQFLNNLNAVEKFISTCYKYGIDTCTADNLKGIAPEFKQPVCSIIKKYFN